MQEKIFSVYVIRSINTSKLYVGMATDIEKRLLQHNKGESNYTKSYIPWELIYSEKIGNTIDARKREKYLKSTAGKNYLRKLGLI